MIADDGFWDSAHPMLPRTDEFLALWATSLAGAVAAGSVIVLAARARRR